MNSVVKIKIDTIIIKAVPLAKVNNVEFVRDTRNHLLNLEEIPLGVSIGVQVCTKY